MLDILINFILGGIVVSGTSLIGTYMNPLLAAIFWAYPITILPSLYFMNQKGKSHKYISKFLVSTTFGLILLMMVTFLMGKFINETPQKDGINYPILKATIFYFIGAIAYYFGVKLLGVEKYFM